VIFTSDAHLDHDSSLEVLIVYGKSARRSSLQAALSG
jgi:metal-responsive CopG/Arc/MetJ family transcriptional regulator